MGIKVTCKKIFDDVDNPIELVYR